MANIARLLQGPQFLVLARKKDVTGPRWTLMKVAMEITVVIHEFREVLQFSLWTIFMFAATSMIDCVSCEDAHHL